MDRHIPPPTHALSKDRAGCQTFGDATRGIDIKCSSPTQLLVDLCPSSTFTTLIISTTSALSLPLPPGFGVCLFLRLRHPLRLLTPTDYYRLFSLCGNSLTRSLDVIYLLLPSVLCVSVHLGTIPGEHLVKKDPSTERTVSCLILSLPFLFSHPKLGRFSPSIRTEKPFLRRNSRCGPKGPCSMSQCTGCPLRRHHRPSARSASSRNNSRLNNTINPDSYRPPRRRG